jgi:REP element-mobilizing transposase RayT
VCSAGSFPAGSRESGMNLRSLSHITTDAQFAIVEFALLIDISSMGLRFDNQKYGQCFFATTTFHNWADYGNIPGVYEAIADSIMYYAKKYNAKITGYVFMPSHLHLLLVLDGKHLANYMRDFKKFVAQKAMRDLGIKDNPIWAVGYDRQVVYTEEVFRTKLDYIHNNPMKSGYVSKAEDWRWSSAGDYLTGTEGTIKIWKAWMF